MCSPFSYFSWKYIFCFINWRLYLWKMLLHIYVTKLFSSAVNTYKITLYRLSPGYLILLGVYTCSSRRRSVKRMSKYHKCCLMLIRSYTINTCSYWSKIRKSLVLLCWYLLMSRQEWGCDRVSVFGQTFVLRERTLPRCSDSGRRRSGPLRLKGGNSSESPKSVSLVRLIQRNT